MKEVRLIKKMISIQLVLTWGMTNERVNVFNIENKINSIINTISEHEKVVDEETSIKQTGRFFARL